MAKKKTFITDNPALQFISSAGEPEQEQTGTAPEVKKAPDGYKLNPLYIEKKTARVQLVLQPSLAEKLRAYCKSSGTSLNDYVSNLIQKALEEK